MQRPRLQVQLQGRGSGDGGRDDGDNREPRQEVPRPPSGHARDRAQSVVSHEGEIAGVGSRRPRRVPSLNRPSQDTHNHSAASAALDSQSAEPSTSICVVPIPTRSRCAAAASAFSRRGDGSSTQPAYSRSPWSESRPSTPGGGHTRIIRPRPTPQDLLPEP